MDWLLELLFYFGVCITYPVFFGVVVALHEKGWFGGKDRVIYVYTILAVGFFGYLYLLINLGMDG